MKGWELKQIFPQFRYSGNLGVEFNSIVLDSRKVSKGAMFVAIKGTHFDSHLKIDEAIQNGATAVVFEESVKIPESVLGIEADDTRAAYSLFSSAFFGFPSKNLKVIGITGTSGKTTTAFWLYKFFNGVLHKKSGFIGTIGEDSGKGFVIKEKFPPTTPDAFYLNRLLSEMVKNDVEYAFLEVSSSAILFKRVKGVTFYSKILTNIAEDHLDVHGSLEDYLQTKLSFFKDKTPSILNRDVSYYEKFAESAQNFVTYGISRSADVSAHVLSSALHYTDFEISFRDTKEAMRLNVGGVFNLYNFLALSAFALNEKVSIESVKYFASHIPQVPGRLKTFRLKKGIVVIDFAHNPYEVEKILNFLNSIKESRLITVIGAVGWSTKKKRKEIGEKSSLYSDIVIVTTDDPRGDDPDTLISDVARFVKHPVIIKDRFEAVKHAVSIMKKGDIVALLGRGEEREIHFKNSVLKMSDEEMLKEII